MSDVETKIKELIEYAKISEGGYYQPEYVSKFNPTFVMKLLESWLDFHKAADGLKYGVDWNNGTHAQVYRPKLLEALKKSDEVFK